MGTPLALTAADEKDSAGYLEVIGRRNAGVSFEQAGAEVDAILRETNQQPQLRGAHATQVFLRLR